MKRLKNLLWHGSAIGGVVLILLLNVDPVWAGGWVVITVDEIPQAVIAGEVTVVSFAVRQHGHTLINLTGSGPRITAHNRFTGATIQVNAQPDRFVGHYRAELNFPTAGIWEWQIHPQPFTTTALMPALLVQPTPAPTGTHLSAAPTDQYARWLLWLQAWLQRLTLTQAEPSVQMVKFSLMQRGHDLFLAKGCAACHVHEAVAVEWTTQSGPNLSNFDKTSAFLALWLADPAAVKPATEMPNLELDSSEIEALSAFLTAQRRTP